MKTRKSIYLIAALALTLGACSPDDHDLANPDLTAEDLVEGKAFTVDVASDNTITLTSLLDKSYNVFWNQPNGRSQGTPYQFQLPFAGEYQVTMGVDTRSGIVYGNPYTFTLSTNNMSLLKDNLYTYLTGGVGHSKKWVPVDKDYGVGQCTGPMMYCSPTDVLNDGTGSSDIGYHKMKPNWDPGFQSWLVMPDSPYMTSSMTFSLDDTKGCSITETRGDDNVTKTGKWNLNLSDKNHPKLSFTDTYLMHMQSLDAACDNYTTDLYITELSPYILQVATMRTNSEGAWWLVWNFVAEDVKTGKVVIPSDAPGYINPNSPKTPTIDDMATKLFTTDINGATFVGSRMTYTFNEDAAYDFLWWDGTNWSSMTGGKYGSATYPKWTDDAIENELTFERKSENGNYTYSYEYGDQSGKFTITDNVLTFDKPITLFTVNGTGRTIALTGKEWTVFKCDPGSELMIGVPAEKDADGMINTYLVADFNYKPVSSQTGPTVVKFDASKVKNYVDNGYLRCQLYNPWGGGDNAVDPTVIKIKKNHKINVTVRLSGLTMTKPVKMALCVNRGSEQGWEPDCFSYSRAITVNGDGTYTVSWVNDTGATANWADKTSALIITMQYDGYCTAADPAKAYTVESITIE